MSAPAPCRCPDQALVCMVPIGATVGWFIANCPRIQEARERLFTPEETE